VQRWILDRPSWACINFMHSLNPQRTDLPLRWPASGNSARKFCRGAKPAGRVPGRITPMRGCDFLDSEWSA